MSQPFQQAWRIYSWTPALGQGFVRTGAFSARMGMEGNPLQIQNPLAHISRTMIASSARQGSQLRRNGAPADACAEVFGTAHWEPCHLK